jgi:hypothetical protein
MKIIFKLITLIALFQNYAFAESESSGPDLSDAYEILGIVGIVLLIIVLLPAIIGILVQGLQKSVLLKSTHSGLTKKGYTGWCWTYFFFGFLVPIVRGEIGIGLMHLVFSLFTFGIFQIVMTFLYNKQYTSRLLESGWEFADNEEHNRLAKKRLGIAG